MGVYTAKYRKEEYKQAYDYLDKSIDLSGKTSSPQVLDIYFKLAEVYMINEDISTDFIMEAYDKVSGVMDLIIDDAELRLEEIMHKIYKLNEDLEQQVVDNEKYLADYEKLRKDSAQIANEFTQLKNVQNNMDFLFSKHAKCEMLVQIYGKKLETNKEERILRQIIKFFNKVKCADNDVYYSAVEELHKIRPEANTAYYMGKIYADKKQYTDALEYYKEAAETYIKESQRIDAYLMMTDCYIKLKQYSAAREIANKILRLNPNKGIAYILIGDAYMASASSCGDVDVPGALCWAAADKYAKAKSVDASITEEADKRLNTARACFPKIEDYWQRGYEKGQSYKIGCWINETTTIR
jgi:tetratricopeptide (TPR) repeat protein